MKKLFTLKYLIIYLFLFYYTLKYYLFVSDSKKIDKIKKIIFSINLKLKISYLSNKH